MCTTSASTASGSDRTPITHYDAAGQARADLCRFLSACYYQPAPEFGEEKLFDSMAAAAAQLDSALAAHARRLGEQFQAEGIESLLRDYTRLFLGPVNALSKPYASVWLAGDKGLTEDSTREVLELYREGGFDIDEDFRDLPDHIAAELEFLYLLIYRENEARLKNEPAAIASFAALRKRFLCEHLACWVSPFVRAMKEGARSAFYRELADFTERFVAGVVGRCAGVDAVVQHLQPGTSHCFKCQ